MSNQLQRDASRDANERAVQASVEAIVTIGPQQGIAMLNPAALRMLVRRSEDVLGAPRARLIPERLRDAQDDHAGRFMSGDEAERTRCRAGCLVTVRLPLQAAAGDPLV